MPVALSVGQACWERYTDWQVMTPTESWNSLRTNCLPFCQPARLPVFCPLGLEVKLQAQFWRGFHLNNHHHHPHHHHRQDYPSATKTSCCNSQPSHCLVPSHSVSLLHAATGLPWVFLLSPSYPVTMSFFFLFLSVSLPLYLFPPSMSVNVTLIGSLHAVIHVLSFGLQTKKKELWFSASYLFLFSGMGLLL